MASVSGVISASVSTSAMYELMAAPSTVKVAISNTLTSPEISLALISSILSAVPSAATSSLMSVRTTEPVSRVPVQSASMASVVLSCLYSIYIIRSPVDSR